MAKEADDVNAARAEEPAAVRTTIVGGRPPGSGRTLGGIPRGVEVLIKKATVDTSFRERLLAERAGAAALVGLKLAPAEEALLANIPAAQLAAVIAGTRVAPHLRAAFSGYAAATMLAALGTAVTSYGDDGQLVTKGIDPNMPMAGVDAEEVFGFVMYWDAAAPDDAGLVVGYVMAPQGNYLAGARVTAAGTDVATTSRDDGYFSLGPLPPGVYTIECVLEGFDAAYAAKVTSRAHYSTQVNFALNWEPELFGGARPDEP
jgi:hypothetical protein